ncbi:GPW/gp25 family protein [Roseobacter sp. YSTF-M11]|uniref:GPW/gp25 family protein n=1 Tax=Roseobacter insulae TaxID=2859783 RepID=A0A9X1FSG3_9RHOB|nr:GPW/gp25 family protein [Roseobacter insulae]MBW4706652.1 GPW/gp25 family protein [Roseobacter insulae]
MADADPSFLGRGWAFPPSFDEVTGQARLVQAEDDIAESLRILMETRPGERVMHPTYGCRLHDLVFEPMDSETEAEIETAISRAILFFEPRIKLGAVTVDVKDALEGRLNITLNYTVVETNERHNMVFPFYITEGTLISQTPVPEA